MDGEKPRAEVQAPLTQTQPHIIMQAPPNQSGVNIDAEMKKLQDTLAEATAASQSELASASKMLEEEVRKGKEREERMKEEMERRVQLLEETIRHEVKQEVTLREKSAGVGRATPVTQQQGGSGPVAPPVKVSGAGELESDDEEEEVLTRTEIAARMRESEDRAGRMEKEFVEFRKSTESIMGEKRKKDEEMEKMREELER